MEPRNRSVIVVPLKSHHFLLKIGNELRAADDFR
jgi:hypothetical protein